MTGMLLLGYGEFCFGDSQCNSGFCHLGRCADPIREHQGCNPDLINCPRHLFCSNYSHTCVSRSFKAKEPCRGISDCPVGSKCFQESCIKVIRVGKICDKDLDGTNDLCATGSICASPEGVFSRCYQLCNAKVDCPEGFQCSKSKDGRQQLCLVNSSNNENSSLNTDDPNNDQFHPDDFLYIAIFVIVAIFVISLFFWACNRLTRTSTRDPALKNRKLRLQREGNGLATISLVPAGTADQPAPRAASQLFQTSSTATATTLAGTSSNNSNNYTGIPITSPPPSYSDAINQQQ